jgi:hypothetical protein
VRAGWLALAMCGKVIIMRPYISLVMIHTKQTGQHANVFTAHG